MPVSPRESNSEAVSEVLGQILIFGILSMVLITSLLAFNVAQAGAQDRVIEVRADSAAQRVAGTVVEASLFAEIVAGDEVSLRSLIDLPTDLDGQSYTVRLDGVTSEVIVVADAYIARAGLFSAGAPASVHVCDTPALPGGPIAVYVETVAPNDTPVLPCQGFTPTPSTLRIITLESP